MSNNKQQHRHHDDDNSADDDPKHNSLVRLQAGRGSEEAAAQSPRALGQEGWHPHTRW